MRRRLRIPRTSSRPWKTLGESERVQSDDGFTLIELIIVTLIIPVIIGAITLALMSVLGLQTSSSSRIAQSGDAQVVSSNFETDVQDASYITTDSTSTSPVTCESSSQAADQFVFSVQENLSSAQALLGSGNGQTEVSYLEVPSVVSGSTTYSLIRNVCQNGNATVPVSTATVSNNVPPNQSVTITCSPTVSANCGANLGWISTGTVTAVTFATSGAGTNAYAYTLVAVPRPNSTYSAGSTVSSPNSNCVFATGSGTYTGSLCFVDMSAWNLLGGTTSKGCPNGALAMTAGINRTEDTLTFCMSVQSTVTATGAPVSGAISQEGINGVAAVSFPTYCCSFLGNNNFYTVASSQEPALYQQLSSVPKTTIVKITNIVVSNEDGSRATGWELVTGDAETTDPGESMTWSSDQDLTLLPNTPTSPVGNACGSVAPTINTTYLTNLGSTTVMCTVPTNELANKSGTVMLEAPSPSTLTVTMVGSGLEAMFVGVLLPYSS
jgi:prepilin-type N-terminal cleavage/methylation domain-containing protein